MKPFSLALHLGHLCSSLLRRSPVTSQHTRPGSHHRDPFLAFLSLGLGWLLLPLAASAQPDPVVTVSGLPSQVLIGDDFTFKVTFRNASTIPGYGPFIDLVIDSGGADKCACSTALHPGGDGLTIVSATLLTGGAIPLASLPPGGAHAPCPPTSGSGIALLPHALAANGPPLGGVVVQSAEALYTYLLPFGHYEATQPDLEIAVRVHVDNWADAGHLLRISARGGFRFGATPADDHTTDPPILSTASLGILQNDSTAWGEGGAVIPTVITLSKGYAGPEGEAATGPNYLNYYPLTYTLNANVADGQTINNLVVEELLPPTIVYQDNVHVWVHGIPVTAGLDYVLTAEPVQTAPQNPPNNRLTINFNHAILGTTAPDDVVATFQFYIPELDANGQTNLPPGCSSIITNRVQAHGDWTPHDPCDGTTAPIPAGPVEHTLTARCLAVQKTVSIAQDLNYPGATPGDLLRYEIRFQISDYKTIGNLVLTDCLSDGHYLEWNNAPWPELTVQDQFGTVQASFDGGNYGADWTVTLDTNCLCSPSGLSANRVTFDISQLMMDQFPPDPRHAAGILTGGWASSPHSTTPATGTLVFYAKIYDEFFFPAHYPGDKYVDKHDPLWNCVLIDGELHKNVNAPVLPPPASVTTSDDSSTRLSIVSAPLRKSVYAINGNTNLPSPLCFGPGDTVTFRLTKTFTSGDAENVVVRDYPPLPVLKVTDPLGSGSSSWSGQSASVPPPAGQWSLGATHSVPAPIFSFNTPNEITFAIGTFNNPANTPLFMDLYFSMTVGSDPFADGLKLNNEATECEDNTLGQSFCDVALAEITICEPNLKLTKGVVACDNPNVVFDPPLAGQPVFTAAGSLSCPRFTPLITSSSLPITSDLIHADAHDRVTFALVVQNLGAGPDGAFDIVIKDILPTCFTNATNICVSDGFGAAMSVVGGNSPANLANLFTSSGIELADPGPTATPAGALDPFSATSGRNLVVITYDATYVPTGAPDCCVNEAALVRYSNREQGANFVAAGVGAQLADDAKVCTAPQPVRKCVVVTSEAHTQPGNSGAGVPQVAIGEIVRYRLVVNVPEGTTPSLQVQDFLPPGLLYLGNAKYAFINGAANDALLPLALSCSPSLPVPAIIPAFAISISSLGPLFNFGSFTNPDNDPNQELLVIEFNVLVQNVPGNQAGVARDNSFAVFSNGAQVGAASAPVSIVVVEPNLSVAKLLAAKPQQIGGVAGYTVTFINQPGAFATTAFDVRLRDVFPACLSQLTLVSVKDGNGSSLTPAANNSTATALDITLASVPVNQSVVVNYTAKLLCADCDKTTNTATVTWTSLPGPNGTCGNATGQCTPGTSGASNGERNGGSGVNDYVVSAWTNLCPDLTITKVAVGSFMAGLNGTYMITVQNLGNGPALAPVTVADTVPGGLTPVSVAGTDWACFISGSTVTCTYIGPAIPPGGAFPPILVSVAINAGIGGATLNNCAQVQSLNDSNPANNQDCVSVPVLASSCLAISNEVITCTTNGTYTFSFDLFNLSAFPAYSVSFAAASPFGVTLTPNPYLLGTPLNPGGPPRHISVNLSGPACATVCFLISIHDQFDVNCCTPNSAIPKCLVLPECECVPAPTRMVGWWRADNNAKDSSGFNNHGTPQGAATYAPGEVDFAFKLATASDYVRVPDNNSLDFGASAPFSSFSIDAWIATTNPAFAVIVDKRDPSTFVGYAFYVTQGQLGFQINGVNYVAGSTTPTVNDGLWYHVSALVDRSAAQLRLYVNATLIATFNISGVGGVANTSALFIGQRTASTPVAFQGSIDEVEIFNRTLTGAEIKSLWQAGCAGKCKCVVAPPDLKNWWTFDEVSGTSASDLNGTVHNTGQHNGATHVPGKVGYGLCFNGANQYLSVPNQAEVNFTGTCPGVADSLTIDAWIKTASGTTTILDKRTAKIFGTSPRGYMLSLVGGKLSFTLADGTSHPYVATAGPSLADNEWHFVAVTYERCANVLNFYVDGHYTPVATFNTGPLGSIVNTAALYVGRRSPGLGTSYYPGCIDELEFFKRALTAVEIYSLWNAGPACKCKPQLAIIGPPTSTAASVGNPAAFHVVAVGDEPLNYQWWFNGVPIADGTNDTLMVSNAQPASVGAYSVTVTNDSCSETSTWATLALVGPSNRLMLPMQGGDALIANQLDHGSNRLSTLLPGGPPGVFVFKYAGGYSVAVFDPDDLVWTPDPQLNPGEGAILRNQSGAPFTITFTGAPVTPSLPLPLHAGLRNLVSRQSLGSGTYEDIVGLPPEEGTVVYRFDPGVGGDATDLGADGYTSYSFVDGAWDGEWMALPGESVWIELPPDEVPPVLVTASAVCASNLVTVLFNEPMGAGSAANPAYYAVNAGLTIGAATLLPDGRTVQLSTSPLQPGTLYTLTVNGVMDLAGNAIAANSQATFSCPTNALPPYTLVLGVSGSLLKFEWSGSAVLQAADHANGPWIPVPGAGSGYLVEPVAPQKFYRLMYP